MSSDATLAPPGEPLSAPIIQVGVAEVSAAFIPAMAPYAAAYPGHPAHSILKRAFDFAVALLALLFILPLLAAAALAVALDSRGPVFFTQKRTGLNGLEIRVLKLRTMTVLEDGDAVRPVGRGDGRVTRVGAFLRRSSIDELPQLLNVLRGEMSLVGPRPHAVLHDQYYGALVPSYRDRFRARPGITGLAQVTGYRGEIRSVDYMSGRVSADNDYIDRWSFALDLRILAMTLLVAPFQNSAY